MTLATVATFGLLRSSMHTLDQSLYRPAPIKKLNRTGHEAKKKVTHYSSIKKSGNRTK